MPSYKLTYFNIKGRAEIIRLLFAAAGVEYEDNRIQGTDWPALKPTLPFQQIPVLEVDGKILAQSMAIANYLANEFGFYGENNMERFEIDQILEIWRESMFYVDRIFKECDKSVQCELMKDAVECHCIKYLNIFEDLLKKNDSDLFVGSKLSLADLVIFNIMDWITDRNAAALDSFPRLLAFKQTISNMENLKHYLETRINNP